MGNGRQGTEWDCTLGGGWWHQKPATKDCLSVSLFEINNNNISSSALSFFILILPGRGPASNLCMQIYSLWGHCFARLYLLLSIRYISGGRQRTRKSNIIVHAAVLEERSKCAFGHFGYKVRGYSVQFS